jgi:hypothetical protein
MSSGPNPSPVMPRMMPGKPTITICSAVWGRLPLTGVWYAGLARVRKRFIANGIVSRLVVVASDSYHAQLFGAVGRLMKADTLVVGPNKPLGAKWNAAIVTARQEWTDYIMILGSDDFLSDAIVDQMSAKMIEGHRHIGLHGLYFADHESGSALRWFGGDRPAGPGRIIASDLMPRRGPWPDGQQWAMDAELHRALGSPAIELIKVGPSAIALDVKYSDNIWGYPQLCRSLPGRVEPASPATIRMAIPEYAKVMALPKPRFDDQADVQRPPSANIRRMSYYELVEQGLMPSDAPLEVAAHG